MNRSESPEAVDILELLVRNPYNQNIPVEEFYRVIKHFYGLEREQFNEAIKQLDEETLVSFVHNSAGDIETMVSVTEKGDNLAVFLFPAVFYGFRNDPRILSCP